MGFRMTVECECSECESIIEEDEKVVCERCYDEADTLRDKAEADRDLAISERDEADEKRVNAENEAEYLRQDLADEIHDRERCESECVEAKAELAVAAREIALLKHNLQIVNERWHKVDLTAADLRAHRIEMLEAELAAEKDRTAKMGAQIGIVIGELNRLIAVLEFLRPVEPKRMDEAIAAINRLESSCEHDPRD